MLADGFHLGENTWSEMPKNSSSVISNIPRKRCFDELSYPSNGQPRQNPRALIDA